MRHWHWRLLTGALIVAGSCARDFRSVAQLSPEDSDAVDAGDQHVTQLTPSHSGSVAVGGWDSACAPRPFECGAGASEVTTLLTYSNYVVPWAIAVDGRGNVYVADNGLVVRKIDPNGNVSTLAGSELCHPSIGQDCYVDGTGGPDGTAEFGWITGLAADARGNVYVADERNARVRKIDSHGNVTTVAGNGLCGADCYADGSGGPNGTAEFSQPFGVAVDLDDYVYVSDGLRIRKIDPLGNVSTLAGNGMDGNADGTGGPDGTAEFDWPSGLAVDCQRNVYVADPGNVNVRKIDPDGNVTTLFAGSAAPGSYEPEPGGDAYEGISQSCDPIAITVDSEGNAYVADCDAEQIKVIDPHGNVTVLAGNGYRRSGCDLNPCGAFADGSAGANGTAEFNEPWGVAVDSCGNVYVADLGNNRIRKISRQ